MLYQASTTESDTYLRPTSNFKCIPTPKAAISSVEKLYKYLMNRKPL